MKKFFKKYRTLFLIILTFLFLIYLTYTLNNDDNQNEIKLFIRDKLLTMEAVLVPKVNVDYTNIIDSINNSLIDENNDLKMQLELNNNSSFKIVNANVIERNLNTYFNSLILDKGESDGIKKNRAVINSEGLVGIIKEVTSNTSTVQLLSSGSLNTPVSIKDNDNTYNGIITNYNYESSLIEITLIRSNNDIKIGDTVITNGLGGIVPSGIIIGKVFNLKENNEDDNIVYVKQNVNLDNLKYLGVIGENNDTN